MKLIYKAQKDRVIRGILYSDRTTSFHDGQGNLTTEQQREGMRYILERMQALKYDLIARGYDPNTIYFSVQEK